MSSLIIHITLGKANPNRANGVNLVVHNLAQSLHAAGTNVEVWGLTPTPKDATFERIYPLRLFERKSHRLGLASDLKRAIGKLPDHAIVHFHGGLLVEFYHIARLLRRRGIAWVLTPHGSYAPGALMHGTLKKRTFIRLFDRFVIENAAAIHALAPNSVAGIENSIDIPNTVVLPNGFTKPEPPFADLFQRPFRFAFCGRIDIYTKGLDLLADAIGELAATKVSFELDLIGAGVGEEQLRGHLDRVGALAQVTFHGPLFEQRKLDVLNSASCFLLTSRHEGFPMSLTEAASLGLPLLVTEGTNYGDLVRDWDCGIVVRDTTAGAIAEAMEEMASLSHERLLEMGRNAVRLVQEELNWTNIAERMSRELYGPIMGVVA